MNSINFEANKGCPRALLELRSLRRSLQTQVRISAKTSVGRFSIGLYDEVSILQRRHLAGDQGNSALIDLKSEFDQMINWEYSRKIFLHAQIAWSVTPSNSPELGHWITKD
jgi:hypothetical protein